MTNKEELELEKIMKDYLENYPSDNKDGTGFMFGGYDDYSDHYSSWNKSLCINQ